MTLQSSGGPSTRGSVRRPSQRSNLTHSSDSPRFCAISFLLDQLIIASIHKPPQSKMSPTNYHWWSRECQQEDPIFGTGQAERGQKFIPLDQLEDEGYTFIFADHAWSLKLVGFRRYVPDIDDSSALRTYPVCEKTGRLIPFVYT